MTDKLESNEVENHEQPQPLLFRMAALEHRSNVDRLELELQLISFPRWLIWLSCFILILCVLIWSIFGSIPIIAQGVGIAVNAQGILNVETPLNGIVASLSAQVGQRVKKGNLLATLFNDVKETQLKEAKVRVQNLKERVDKLQKQIQLEGGTQKEAIQKEILAAQYKIHSLTTEIPIIQQDVKNQEELAQQGLFDYKSLQQYKELLWSTQMDLEKTKANLANFQFLLKKGYREEELEALREQLLQAKQDLALLETQLRYKKIFSPANGTILEWFVQPGGYIGLGDPVVRLEVQGAKSESIIFYGFLPLEVGKKIRPGTEVEIELTTVKAQEYGAILGKITRVSQYAISPEYITQMLQNPSLIEYLMQRQLAVLEVIIEPELDSQTFSGYRWTSGKGPRIKLTSGTLCVFKGVIEEVKPILYVFPFWWVKKIYYQIEPYLTKRTQRPKVS